MKQKTKKSLAALFIVLTFGLSSIAFVATGFFGSAAEEEIKPLESNIVNGEIDLRVEGAYVQAGYTWIKYYDENLDQNSRFVLFLDSLPSTLTTPTGQEQIVVQKIQKKYLNETRYVVVTSAINQVSFSETDELKVFDAACDVMTVTPLECGIRNIAGRNNGTNNSA